MSALTPPLMTADRNSKGRHSAAAGTPLLLCFSHLRWDFVWQRPQHLLSRAAEYYRVIIFEEPVFEDVPTPRLRQVARGKVTVATPVFPDEFSGADVTMLVQSLLDELVSSDPNSQRIFWYYTPMALPFSRHIVPDLCIYDNMDELSRFRGAPPSLLRLETELFRRADLVFTGGQSLYDSKKKRHASVHLFPSSVDAAHFAAARKVEHDPADQASIGRPRFGFFGVIDERMDLDLVGAVADLRPDWQFVMIGPVVKIDPVTLPQRPNVHWLGSKDYRDLPKYMGGWDVGFMPFALNDSTRFISPTKTPEFLAAGLPVISTPIMDVVRPYGEKSLVVIAGTAEAIVAEGEEILRRGRPAAWSRRVDQHIASMSWNFTFSEMRRLMSAELARDRSRRQGAAQAAVTAL